MPIEFWGHCEGPVAEGTRISLAATGVTIIRPFSAPETVSFPAALSFPQNPRPGDHANVDAEGGLLDVSGFVLGGPPIAAWAHVGPGDGLGPRVAILRCTGALEVHSLPAAQGAPLLGPEERISAAVSNLGLAASRAAGLASALAATDRSIAEIADAQVITRDRPRSLTASLRIAALGARGRGATPLCLECQVTRSASAAAPLPADFSLVAVVSDDGLGAGLSRVRALSSVLPALEPGDVTTVAIPFDPRGALSARVDLLALRIFRPWGDVCSTEAGQVPCSPVAEPSLMEDGVVLPLGRIDLDCLDLLVGPAADKFSLSRASASLASCMVPLSWPDGEGASPVDVARALTKGTPLAAQVTLAESSGPCSLVGVSADGAVAAAIRIDATSILLEASSTAVLAELRAAVQARLASTALTQHAPQRVKAPSSLERSIADLKDLIGETEAISADPTRAQETLTTIATIRAKLEQLFKATIS